MNVLITGGSGFLGQRLMQALLASPEAAIEKLVIADQAAPRENPGDGRVEFRKLDLANPAAATELLSGRVDAIFHLAAVVSSHAEADFDTGMRVNVDATRGLLEAVRATGRSPRFIFASSLAVFGPPLPRVVTDDTAAVPSSSYGMEKAVGELLVNEYSRRGFVDGRVLRLPTISVRPGLPNRAASSFASGIIREPLRGVAATCPVGPDVELWLSSPGTAIANLIHAMTLPAGRFGPRRIVNLPGITVSVGEMIAALSRVAGPAVAERVTFSPDEGVNRIVANWPARFDVTISEGLGFARDRDMDGLIRAHIDESRRP